MKDFWWIGVLLAFLAVVFLVRRRKSGVPNEYGAAMQPNGKNCKDSRGVRNNNPGNLIRSNDAWRGKIPHAQSTDERFEQFETWVMGVRAMTKLLSNYIKGGHNTISKIVNRYAPPSENSTQSYIGWVVKKTGWSANRTLIADKTTLRALVKAMSEMELGCDLITDAEFDQAFELL
jgi:hypothetical protein